MKKKVPALSASSCAVYWFIGVLFLLAVGYVGVGLYRDHQDKEIQSQSPPVLPVN